MRVGFEFGFGCFGGRGSAKKNQQEGCRIQWLPRFGATGPSSALTRVEDAHFIPHAKVRLGDVRVQRPQLDPVGLEQEGDVHERLPGPRHIPAPDHADGDAARGGALAHDAVIVRRHLAVRRREADGVDAAAGARERDPLEAVCGPRAEQLRGAEGGAARQRRVGRDVEERDRVLPSAPPPPTPTP